MLSLSRIFNHPNTPEPPADNPWGDSKGNDSKGSKSGNGKPTGPSSPWNSKPARPHVIYGGNQGGGNRGNNQGGGNQGGPPFGLNLNNLAPAKLVIFIIPIIVLIWLASGLYRVQPGENGVILHFGKYTDTVVDPGLHYHLPWPIQTVLKPNVMFERRVEIGFRGVPYRENEKQDVPAESMILTGDANIVDLDFVVQWKIENARHYLFNIRNGEETLKRVAESAMREVIGQNDLQDIITDKRSDIAVRVRTIMQDILKSYQTGIMVTQVLIQDASVPEPVYLAYEDVRKAAQEAETMRNQALQYSNEILPRAQGSAIQIIKQAEGYKQQVVSGAEGDSQRFLNILGAYSNAKSVTKQRLYIEMWEHILNHNSPVIVDGGENTSPLSYLNLNTLDRMRRNTDAQTSQTEAR